jgi:glycosyltransferase involved in cell wall biosynthesis
MNNAHLDTKRVILLAHVLTSVPAEDLKEYLLNNKTKELMYIGHPLYYSRGRPGSFFELIKDRKLVKKIQLRNYKINQFVRFPLDFILSIFWILLSPRKWDLIISLDNLNTLVGLLLRTIGKIDKVIYYTIDFTPQRFNNRFVNSFYHFLEKICVRYSDLTWNVSPRIAEGREKVCGMNPIIYNRQVVVSVGVWLERISVKKYKDIDSHTIVYAGGLAQHQGIQLVLESLPVILKKIPDVKFIIIGMGSYETELKRLTNKLKIEKYVKFVGYLEKMSDVENIMTTCGVAVAMYNKDLSKWSYYADPSKIKSYLACGLPVITTPLTYITKDLEKLKCGIVCPYNSKKLAKSIIRLISDETLYRSFRKNALIYSKEYDWNKLFSNGLKELYK